MLIEVSEVDTFVLPEAVGIRSATQKTVVIADDWGLCRYNSTRPAVIPNGRAIVGRKTNNSVVAEVVV
jgi:hypothetical protein